MIRNFTNRMQAVRAGLPLFDAPENRPITVSIDDAGVATLVEVAAGNGDGVAEPKQVGFKADDLLPYHGATVKGRR